jgi:hypothetical protein
MHSEKELMKPRQLIAPTIIGQISILATIALMSNQLQAYSAPKAQEINLKEDHQQVKQAAVQRLTECAQLERQFNEFDLYRSASSSKTYGVDVRGRVWTLKRDAAQGCSLRTHHRLNRSDYELDYLGKRIWSTFYYEDKQLCLYTRSSNEKPARRCYQPVGIISRFAPYFLN